MRPTILVIVLGVYLQSSLLAFEGSKIGFDITHLVDAILLETRSNVHLSLLANISQKASLLHYESALAAPEIFPGKFTQITGLLLEAGWKRDGVLLISLGIEENLEFLHADSPSRLTSWVYPKDTPPPRIIFRWNLNQSCKPPENFTSFKSGYTKIGSHFNVSSPPPTGVSYKEADIGCIAILQKTRRGSDLLVVSVELIAGIRFVESYGMFADYMNGIVERQRKFWEMALSQPETVYLLKLYSTWKITAQIEDQYERMYAQFAGKWASQAGQNVVVVGSDVVVQNVEDVNVESFLASVGDVAIPHLNTRDFHVVSQNCALTSLLVPLTTTLFRTVILGVNDWSTMLDCQQNTTQSNCVQLNSSSANNNISLMVTVRSEEFPEMVDHLLETHDELCNPPLQTVILDSELLHHRSANNSSEKANPHQFSKYLKKGTQLGCSIELPDLADLGVFYSGDDLAEYTILMCNLDELGSIIRVINWQVSLFLESAEDSGFNYDHYVTNLQRPLLNTIWLAREQLVKSFPQLQVDLLVSTDVSQNFIVSKLGQEIYCNSRVQKAEQYYEAIANWGYMLGLRVSLKAVVDVFRGFYPAWWGRVLTTPNLYDLKKFAFFTLRNYPESMGYLDGDPCVRRTLTVPRDGIPLTSAIIGATIHSPVLPKHILATKELQLMLDFALHKFPRVEIVLDPAVGVSGANFLKGLDTVAAALQESVVAQTSNSNGTELYIEIPLEDPQRHSFDQQSSQIRKVLDSISSNPNLPHLNIHISGWEEILHRHSSDILSFVARVLPTSGVGRKARRVGLVVENCLHAQNGIGPDPRSPLLSSHFSYLVCANELNVSNFEASSAARISNSLNNHLFLKKAFAQVLPKLELFIRLNIISEGHSEDFLRAVNDLRQFASFYSINYFGFRAFDNNQNGSGWWIISNHSDLTNVSVYKERESEFLNRSTWRPSYPPLEDGGDLSNGELIPGWVLYLIAILSACFLCVTIVAGVLGTRLKMKSRFLSKEEVEEYLQGMSFGREGSAGTVINGIKFNPEFEIPKTILTTESSRLLGTGNFSTVYKALVNGVWVALKIPHGSTDKDSFKTILREVKVMIHVGSHPNVVAFVGAYLKEIRHGVVHIATQLWQNGSLQSFLRTLSLASADRYQLAKFATDIASGMGYVGSKQVVHGDLSTRNIFLDEVFNCKIGDFGLSRKLYEVQQHYVKKDEEPCAWRWSAYESLKRLEFSSKSDVWSYGITLWEIYSLGDTPYPGLSYSSHFLESIYEGLRPNITPLASGEIYDKMLMSWNIQPELRPDFEYFATFFVSIRSGEYAQVGAGV